MSLADYDRRKFELAEVVRALANVRPQPAPASDPVQDLLTRLAEDRFNLVVVGRFSRGKSSLMNAILGAPRLPTGILPLTSVITAVGYGSQEQVRLTFDDRLLQTDISLSDLRGYVTQEGNPGNRQRVKLAEIQLPAEILRRGFYFIDTPGLGSAIWENTQTTQAYLPQADAFLLVTGFESPLSVEEDEVLRRVASAGKPLFVAINKQDTVAPADREAAVSFVRDQLREIFGDAGGPEPFATSAIDGLSAKQAGDAAALEASGVGPLEAALIRFLVADKSEAFLRGMCDRVQTQLAATPEAPATLHADLRAIRGRLAPGPSGGEGALGGLTIRQPEAAGTCAICRAVEAACYDFLATYQYELTVDGARREAFTQAGGFCALHTWRYNAITSPHGVCLSCPPLTEYWAARLAGLAEAAEDAPTTAAALRAHGGSPARCPACHVSDAAQRAAVAGAAAQAATPADIDHASAFCLPHLAALIEALPSADIRKALLRRQAGLFERVGEDMRRYALKFDARRRPLASRAEVDAPLRSLRLLAGLANLSFIKRQD
jgi:predicted GTPase